MRMRTLLTISALAALTIVQAGDALAQSRSGNPAPELSATYGTMWGGNIGLGSGKLRTGTGGSLGFALDVPVRPDTYLELGYTRQDGSLDWDPRLGGKVTITDMSVNVWQLGSLRTFGHPGGPLVPFAQGALGLTYFSPSASSVTIDGTDYPIDGMTKFSISFGLGFKAYFGRAQRVGLRGSFKVISTLYDAGGGVFFGPGGVELGVSGSGIWQYEAAGGLTVKFGR